MTIKITNTDHAKHSESEGIQAPDPAQAGGVPYTRSPNRKPPNHRWVTFNVRAEHADAAERALKAFSPAPEGALRAAFESWALHTPPDERTNWEVFQAGARAAQADEQRSMFCLVCEARGKEAPVALTRDQVEELFADGLGYEPKAVIVREIVAEFCRVNGIPAPKEPTNDR